MHRFLGLEDKANIGRRSFLKKRTKKLFSGDPKLGG
jgi:hypothetical protein